MTRTRLKKANILIHDDNMERLVELNIYFLYNKTNTEKTIKIWIHKILVLIGWKEILLKRME